MEQLDYFIRLLFLVTVCCVAYTVVNLLGWILTFFNICMGVCS